MGCLEFLKVLSEARLVLTDSGDVQEETTILKVPCLALRESTERPITVEMGSNRIVGVSPERILAAHGDVMRGGPRSAAVPPLWGGHAAERTVRILCERLAGS